MKLLFICYQTSMKHHFEMSTNLYTDKIFSLSNHWNIKQLESILMKRAYSTRIYKSPFLRTSQNDACTAETIIRYIDALL